MSEGVGQRKLERLIMVASILLLLLSSLAVQRVLCYCYDPQCNCDELCEEDSHWSPRDPPSVNTSLEREAGFSFQYGDVELFDCSELNLYWEILRADGKTELYTVLNETYNYERFEQYTDKGLEIYGERYHSCNTYLTITPTDMRYDGAQITAILSIPACSDSPFSSDTMTLHIQGPRTPAPAEVQVEQVSVDTVSVSWSPPFTLEGVPILHYTVYTTSSTGYSEAVNTTQTQVSLQRPCSDTSYQVSGWNEVGEGNISFPVTYTPGLPTPPTNVDIITRPAGLQISWSAPADWEDCITHYSIYTTDSSGTVSVTNTTDGNTSYTVAKPCSDFEVEVSGWSEGGEGERNRTKEVDADLTVSDTNLKTISNLMDVVICASCFFTAGSEAEGCAVELESEAHTYLFNMSRSTSGGGELSQSVLDCFTVGEAGDYSVHVYEIQCNGELGHRNKKLADISVASIKHEVTDEKANATKSTNEDSISRNVTATQSSYDSVVIALAVMLGLTVVGLVLAILACVTAAVVMKWRMIIHSKHFTIPESDRDQMELKSKYNIM